MLFLNKFIEALLLKVYLRIHMLLYIYTVLHKFRLRAGTANSSQMPIKLELLGIGDLQSFKQCLRLRCESDISWRFVLPGIWPQAIR